MIGISILICCHNSARVLPATLEHLKSQQAGDIPWEIILVNTSDDETAEVARRSWANCSKAPLQIVEETQRGLGSARARGFDTAHYDLVSCVDDDNWVASDWVAQVARIMTEHTEVGACGGATKAVFQKCPPKWFAHYQNYFAISQSPGPGRYTDVLWGAGMTIRRSIWQRLRASSFEPLAHMGAEDIELSLLIRLAGWKLWVDPALQLKHYITTPRLNWGHFLAAHRRGSADLVRVDPYNAALSRVERSGESLRRERWLSNLAHVTRCLLQNLVVRPHKVLGRKLDKYAGDTDVFRIEGYIGRLVGLLRNRQEYNKNLLAIVGTDWAAIAGPAANSMSTRIRVKR